MEATIGFEFHQGINELVIKEAAIVSDDAVQTFLFRPPYHIEPHGSDENGLKWADGHIPYDQVKTLLSELRPLSIICTLWAMTNVNFSTVFSIEQYTIMKTLSVRTP